MKDKKIIKLNENDTVLIISDLQFPFAHKHWYEFLRHIKKKYRPTKIINIGDEVDLAFLNYHEKDPDGLSANEEYSQALKEIARLKRLFPHMSVCWSNHGSLHLRKAKTSGILKTFLKSPQEIWNVPNWHWYNEIILTQKNRPDILCVHNLSSSAEANMKARGCSVVQGHHHSSMEIIYSTNQKNQLLFGATIGCLINRKKYVFNYAKNDKELQQLGVMLIENGSPRVIPMIVDRHNNWVGLD
jgi:hypothetical protein